MGWEGCAESSRIRLGRGTTYLAIRSCIITNHKLVSPYSGSTLVLGQATGNTDSLDSPQPGLRGSHQLPPYSIICVCPRDLHPNGFLSRDSSLKLSRFGLSRLWELITPSSHLRLGWSLSKLVALLKSFPTVCCTPPSHTWIGSILDF
jgi:hypothetical protein